MDTSIFKDKEVVPRTSELAIALNETYDLWNSIRDYVHKAAPDSVEEWKYSGKKFGWSFRANDKKRVIVYLLPRKGYFKVAFVFGQKATDAIMDSTISDTIKHELLSAKAYAEGRGIRIDIRGPEVLEDIRNLIEIKLTY
jgi:hypothetical protein